ncbi:MAG: hypothetical protein ACE5LC_09450 [Candidatus Aminicenantales bacterium]
MRRVVSIFICLFFILIYSSVISFSQTDLSGRWEGTTEVPDMGEDELILVLKKDNGSYTGTISDSMGMLMETEIEDVEIEDNTLTFNFTVFTGEDYMKVYVTLNVEGEKMSGYWETEDGSSGSIELEKVE